MFFYGFLTISRCVVTLLLTFKSICDHHGIEGSLKRVGSSSQRLVLLENVTWALLEGPTETSPSLVPQSVPYFLTSDSVTVSSEFSWGGVGFFWPGFERDVSLALFPSVSSLEKCIQMLPHVLWLILFIYFVCLFFPSVIISPFIKW